MERMHTVPELAQFFGITPQAARQRIIEGRLEVPKDREKGAAEEHRISAETIQYHYDLTDVEKRQFSEELVRYRVGFIGWGLGVPFPEYKSEHSTYDKAVAEANRVLAMLRDAVRTEGLDRPTPRPETRQPSVEDLELVAWELVVGPE